MVHKKLLTKPRRWFYGPNIQLGIKKEVKTSYGNTNLWKTVVVVFQLKALLHMQNRFVHKKVG